MVSAANLELDPSSVGQGGTSPRDLHMRRIVGDLVFSLAEAMMDGTGSARSVLLGSRRPGCSRNV